MQPMLATPGALPVGAEWLYEVMWDGVRVLAEVRDEVTRLTLRDGRDVTAHFPELAGLVDVAPDLVLDGEVVMLDRGVPSFAALAGRLLGPVPAAVAAARPVTFMVFDVLRLYGVGLVDRPLQERRATLERLDLDAAPTVAVSPAYTDGEALFAATAQQGMEGVVAKRRADPYRAASRSPGWVTVAHRRTATCVVGGWRLDRGRVTALLLGVPAGSALRYVGTVDVGLAGDAAQRALEPALVAAVAPPFAIPPHGPGIRWAAPVLVVEVAHEGTTADGRLRAPVFRGVRDDVDPRSVGGH